MIFYYRNFVLSGIGDISLAWSHISFVTTKKGGVKRSE